MSVHAQEALRGDNLAGARLIRYLEEGDPRGIEGLSILYPHSGRAYLLGITGPSGAGKSTLIDRIIGVLRARELKVAVLAVDPSSPFSGGAVLADRVRMQRHANDDGVFIRSMATRDRLGGLATTTKDAAIVLDSMGYDVILVETVGVGQNELDIAGLVHTTAVICVPGLGDGLQAIKAGIMEIGDVFVVNKSDRPGADEAVSQLAAVLELRSVGDRGWRPPVIRTTAVNDKGAIEFVDTCFAHRKYLSESGQLTQRVLDGELRLFKDYVQQMLYEQVFGASSAENGDLHSVLTDLRLRRTDPRTAAKRAMRSIRCRR